VIADRLIKIAVGEIGVEEVGNTNCGQRVNIYKAATNLDPSESWPWCAAFVCWCVREAMKKGGPYTFKRPVTASAFNFENWSLAQDESTNTKSPTRGDIEAGDIVSFKFSHIGIAEQDIRSDLTIRTIEGNTDAAGSREGGGVWRKVRRLDQIKTRIRFTV